MSGRTNSEDDVLPEEMEKEGMVMMVQHLPDGFLKPQNFGTTKERLEKMVPGQTRKNAEGEYTIRYIYRKVDYPPQIWVTMVESVWDGFKQSIILENQGIAKKKEEELEKKKKEEEKKKRPKIPAQLFPPEKSVKRGRREELNKFVDNNLEDFETIFAGLDLTRDKERIMADLVDIDQSNDDVLEMMGGLGFSPKCNTCVGKKELIKNAVEALEKMTKQLAATSDHRMFLEGVARGLVLAQMKSVNDSSRDYEMPENMSKIIRSNMEVFTFSRDSEIDDNLKNFATGFSDGSYNRAQRLLKRVFEMIFGPITSIYQFSRLPCQNFPKKYQNLEVTKPMETAKFFRICQLLFAVGKSPNEIQDFRRFITTKMTQTFNSCKRTSKLTPDTSLTISVDQDPDDSVVGFPEDSAGTSKSGKKKKKESGVKSTEIECVISDDSDSTDPVNTPYKPPLNRTKNVGRQSDQTPSTSKQSVPLETPEKKRNPRNDRNLDETPNGRKSVKRDSTGDAQVAENHDPIDQWFNTKEKQVTANPPNFTQSTVSTIHGSQEPEIKPKTKKAKLDPFDDDEEESEETKKEPEETKKERINWDDSVDLGETTEEVENPIASKWMKKHQ